MRQRFRFVRFWESQESASATIGISGLGLEAQQEAVRNFIKQRNAALVSEFTEVESGVKQDRKEMQAALEMAEREGATLLIAKLDRLARSVSFISKLLDGKVPFITCDMPEANRMTLQISAVFAEHEAKMISERTKAALAAAKARGVKLGGSHPSKQAAAQAFAESIRADIQTLLHAGITKPAALAKALNERNVRTSGGQAWGPGQVVRLLRRLNL